MRNVKLRVTRYTKNSWRDIDETVTSVTTSGDIASAFRTAEISLSNTTDGHKQVFNVKNGHQIRVYDDKTELFRGLIFSTTIDTQGTQSLTIHDYNAYLTKTTDNMRFNKLKASDIVKRICAKYGIKVGTIHDTGHVIPKLIFRGETLYDMIVIALTETEKKNRRTFSLVNKKGSLHLLERKTQLRTLIIDDDRNLLSASYTESIEERKTVVKVESEDGKVTAVARDAQSVKDYGTMQALEVAEKGTKKAAATALAKRLLSQLNKTDEEFNVEVMGVHGIHAGTAVVVNDRMTDARGSFYVITDSHTIDANGLHTMSLRLSKTLDIERKDYVKP